MGDINQKKEDISARYSPFLNEILKSFRAKIHSVHMTGSALTEDYDPKHSDINSIIVLNKMDLKFLEIFAPLGKKYGKKRIAAPLIMTPTYIRSSLDVFPLEFLNIKILHATVHGDDIFQDLEIKRRYLRLQCERELKARLISLRQNYISAAGDKRILTAEFIESFAGYMPLFRAIIFLLGGEAPQKNDTVLKALENVSGVATDVFMLVSQLRRHKEKLSIDELNTIFEDYYDAVERLGDITDALDI